MPLPNDKYGRTVSMSTIGLEDVYEVGSGPDFTVSFPTGTATNLAYLSIEGNAPDSFVVAPSTDNYSESEFTIPVSTTHDFTELKYDKNVYIGATLTYIFVQATTLNTEVGTTYLTNDTSNVTQASSGGYLRGDIGIDLYPIISGDYVVLRAVNNNVTYPVKVRIKIESLKG